jgi:hypothetical protein
VDELVENEVVTVLCAVLTTFSSCALSPFYSADAI